MAVTLRMVAKHVGVSEAAVSCVLNGRYTATRVSEGTRGRILAAARELNYHPNALARDLARQRTEVLYLVPPDAWSFPKLSHFTSEMLQGVTEAAMKTSYDLMLRLNPKAVPAEEAAALTSGRVDGALLLRHRNDPLLPLLTQKQFPFVLMYCLSTDPDVWFVGCDNVLGGRLATEHLLSLGHRRILHLTASIANADAEDRREGYRQALQAPGIANYTEWSIPVTWQNWSGSEIAQVTAALQQSDRPTAVFAWYDGAASRLLELAAGLGLRVPQDLSVIGFDSTDACDHINPPLTSVFQPVRKVAEQALMLLIARIVGEENIEKQRVFLPELNERASCARVSL